jgi:hypothetical protein
VVVGIRARTSQRTIGSFSRRVGVGNDVSDESTGIEGASRARDGVSEPGVEGGVKAGEIRLAGGSLVSWPAG